MSEKIGAIDNYVGQELSLNMKVVSYLGIGTPGKSPEGPPGVNFKLWFCKDNWCQTVPEDLSPEEVSQIDSAINSGKLIIGKEWIPTIDKDPNILVQWRNDLKSSRMLDDKFKEKFRHLVKAKSEGNYTAHEILQTLIADETKRNRQL